MENRPVLTIPPTKLERWLDVLSLVILIGSVVYLLLKWSHLQGTIPIHFDGRGEADGWGSKGTLWITPLLAVIIYAGMTILRNYPHKFNYLGKITQQNARSQYTAARHLLSWVKLEIVALFGYLEWATVQAAQDRTSGLGLWMLPVTLGTLLGTVVIYMIRAGKTV